ncbi:hypothetical protein AN191_11675 [Loktanella sp. 5RATIMAR09]|uniref:hypothetical protein n=1 Tax=Loktanella sp. 5RATIMAR09 TaxID=1225655 RepID=UPI0006EB2C4E|nr:hypothetical protein [Loktanella sp. 5RATIMAR09]KQI71641.1 hypothetical protein AN191_11675 [Loktanella sp. 5RATIMAR09]
MKNVLFITIATATVLASPGLGLIAQEKPETGDLALVIAWPFGGSIDRVLHASEMTDAYPNRAPLGAFVHLETPHSYHVLIENGAWLVLRGEEILKLC